MSYFSIAMRDLVYAMFRRQFEGTDEEFWGWMEQVMVLLWARIVADERIVIPMEAITLVTEAAAT